MGATDVQQSVPVSCTQQAIATAHRCTASACCAAAAAPAPLREYANPDVLHDILGGADVCRR